MRLVHVGMPIFPHILLALLLSSSHEASFGKPTNFRTGWVLLQQEQHLSLPLFSLNCLPLTVVPSAPCAVAQYHCIEIVNPLPSISLLMKFLWIFRFYRVVDGETFLANFASDRRHMRHSNGRWVAPPPFYPPIRGANAPTNSVHNLSSFKDVSKADIDAIGSGISPSDTMTTDESNSSSSETNPGRFALEKLVGEPFGKLFDEDQFITLFG